MHSFYHLFVLGHSLRCNVKCGGFERGKVRAREACSDVAVSVCIVKLHMDKRGCVERHRCQQAVGLGYDIKIY